MILRQTIDLQKEYNYTLGYITWNVFGKLSVVDIHGISVIKYIYDKIKFIVIQSVIVP